MMEYYIVNKVVNFLDIKQSKEVIERMEKERKYAKIMNELHREIKRTNFELEQRLLRMINSHLED